MRKLFFVAVIALSGCAIPPPSEYLAVMQNKKTGQTVQCKPSAQHDLVILYPEEEMDHCIKAYEKAGFIRIDDHDDAKK